MKSIKQFKRRIVEDTNSSYIATEDHKEHKISEIRSSSYKLNRKDTCRTAVKINHSIEKKSPIRVAQKNK